MMDEHKLESFSVANASDFSGREMTSLAGRLFAFIRQYKTPLLGLLLVALGIGIGVPVMKYRRSATAVSFARDMHTADKGLKKEESYRRLIAEFGALPASALGRIRLAQHYTDNQEPDKAIAVLNEGLATAGPDIMGTLITLKLSDALKSQGKPFDAATALSNHHDKMLSAFVNRAKLMEAELLLSADRKEEARAVLQSVAAMGVGQESEEKAGFDPETVDEAKETLLLLDLDVL